MIRLLALALLFADTANAGALSLYSPSPPPLVICSTLPSPNVTPVSASPGDNLQSKIGTACGSGPGIVELAAGTYTDQNVLLGTGGQAIGGECVIRAANTASRPLIRAAIGVNQSVFQLVDVTNRVRLEYLRIDGRRSEQTDAVITPCEDNDENAGAGDGVCDSTDVQNLTNAHGIWSRITSTGSAQICVLNTDVTDTVGDAITVRDQNGSTTESVSTTNTGCDRTTCPLITAPLDYLTQTIVTVGRGTNFIDSTRVIDIGSTHSYATKQGSQCFDSDNCHIVRNTISHIGLQGITMLGSSGSVIDNSVTTVGQDWLPNTPSTNSGVGIGVVDGITQLNFTVRVRNNVVTSTWGDGIQIGLTADNTTTPTAYVESNSIVNPCTDRVASDSAGLSLGDTTDPYAFIRSVGNTVTGSECASAVRVSKATSFVGSTTSISGTTSGKGVIYDHASIADSGVVTDKNIEISAGTTGSLTGCTLNGGATVSDSSGGGVTRSGGC